MSQYSKSESMDLIQNSNSFKCNHELDFFQMPPSLKIMEIEFPHILPNKSINRELYRCRLCDLNLADQTSIDVQFPPPQRKNLVHKIESDIKLAKELIEEGVRKDEMLRAVPVLEKKLEAAANTIRQKILQTWRLYWSIWGQGVDNTGEVQKAEAEEKESEAKCVDGDMKPEDR